MASLALGWREIFVREIRRKAIHLTGLSVPILLITSGRSLTAAFVATALAVAMVLETLRIRGKLRLPAVRSSEEGHVAGYVYFILGSLLTVLLFKPMIAVASMLMLCLGDAFSAIIGSVLQGSNVRERVPGEARRAKPLTVQVGMLAACAIIGYGSSGITHLSPAVYMVGAVGATLADSIPVFIKGRPVDDNFSIPILSGMVMTAASLL